MADLSVTAASVAKGANAQTKKGTAGATITAGQALYADANDSNKLKPAIDTSLAAAAVVGVALNGAASGQPVEYVYSDDDFTPGATVAVGVIYVVGAAAGGISPSADLTTGEFASIIGIGKSTTKIKLFCNPLGQAGAAMA